MEELQALLSTWLDPRVVGEVVMAWSGRVLAALAIFVIGRWVLRALTGWVTRAMRRVGVDDTLTRFLGNLLYMVLLVFLVLTAFSALGVPTTNFLAIVGAAGLAVGLALKDSLSNFSSGVMLVFFRPFKVGDQIDAAGVGGVVESIGIFNVVLKTPDNRVITVPNSLIYAGAITNYNAESTRRVDLTIAIGYDADIPQAKSVIEAIVAAETRIAKHPVPEVAVQDVLLTAVTLAVRVWVASADYPNVRSDLLERMKRALDKYGLSIPAEQRLLPPTRDGQQVKESLRTKLMELVERHEEVARLLGDGATISDKDRFRELSKEYARLDEVTRDFNDYRVLEDDLTSAEELRAGSDLDMRALADDEHKVLVERRTELEGRLLKHLVPKDPDDDANLFLEVRAGTGGDEAAIFAGDLFRMYSRYAERQGWAVEVLSANPGEHGGYREVISRVAGKGAYSKLKFESGVHRVQRVPDTEAQGRIHTSTCTVAVFPEPEDIGEIEINKADLKVDTYRASGAGGQHVNKTDSAIRITHLPTGIVVECQDERSQHKNRARAMSLLSARLRDAEETKRQTETAEKRRSLVGTGDRSERIRTYNFPQGRLTDHRINLTLYKVEDIVNGDLDDVIGPLANEYQADLLGAMGLAS